MGVRGSMGHHREPNRGEMKDGTLNKWTDEWMDGNRKRFEIFSGSNGKHYWLFLKTKERRKKNKNGEFHGFFMHGAGSDLYWFDHKSRRVIRDWS